MSGRRLVLAVLLGLLGVNLVVGLVYTLPRYLSNRTLAAQAKVLEAEVERGRKLIAAQKRRAAILAENAKDQDALYHQVLSDPRQGLVPTLTELEEMTGESGLKRGAETLQSARVKGAPILDYSIQIPFEGSYPQMVDLLSRIESSKRFLVIDHVDLSSPTENAQHLSIALSAYFLVEGSP